MYRHTCLKGSLPHNRLQGLFLTLSEAETAPSSADIRLDLVARVRREIAEGVYETADKWQAALDRLLAERLE